MFFSFLKNFKDALISFELNPGFLNLIGVVIFRLFFTIFDFFFSFFFLFFKSSSNFSKKIYFLFEEFLMIYFFPYFFFLFYILKLLFFLNYFVFQLCFIILISVLEFFSFNYSNPALEFIFNILKMS